MNRRVNQGLERGAPFAFLFNGKPVQAHPGETIAAALLAAEVRQFRSTAKSGLPRGLYCGMGVCWECLVMVDGQPSARACMTEARPGMRVETQQGVGRADRP